MLRDSGHRVNSSTHRFVWTWLFRLCLESFNRSLCLFNHERQFEGTTNFYCYRAVVLGFLGLLFVLELTVQSSNMWQDFHCKLIAIPDAHLGILARAHTSWRARDDDRSHWQSSSL